MMMMMMMRSCAVVGREKNIQNPDFLTIKHEMLCDGSEHNIQDKSEQSTMRRVREQATTLSILSD